ncbi:hypothetical protein [Streptococcus dysgalactiae]|uniref:Uncharacterized protein n=1 Tax=Streptococcus dysgalactiae subsp. dysgalactiae TaxID=99822 RepID=A0A9X7RXU0_STRDY|nr:hypothetical protein [Streptococcus dysgalactiae]QGH01219.1 hypothetical protein EA457_00875 [Streptococcus dysgalactiae subsp. dysgalactiae]
MNKRIKKKRKLETAVVVLIKEVTELRAIVSVNAQATNNELTAIKGLAFDNQAAIADIAIDVNYIKQNYKRKWGR